MTEALRTIIGGSPAASAEAIRTLRAIGAGSPVVQTRYNRTVELALADPAAEFTAGDRRILAESVAAEDDTAGRAVTLHVRLTAGEAERVREDAATRGESVSAYVRARLFA